VRIRTESAKRSLHYHAAAFSRNLSNLAYRQPWLRPSVRVFPARSAITPRRAGEAAGRSMKTAPGSGHRRARLDPNARTARERVTITPSGRSRFKRGQPVPSAILSPHPLAVPTIETCSPLIS
jgi:hypothetical protein